ncbi:uncharacterized protein LOC109861501 isoform X2 [Pseudomyrmex gracilis]|uniref:uncharacterized protein LOC109861501 isoform X2 n=1 Tax=Pseudomyrmex gracilis TaxID=219809 RepID=UPI0009957E85|nr:uncharacterized protein LOC109861501 isoform X2 [Pseudomyrmex gracilis]
MRKSSHWIVILQLSSAFAYRYGGPWYRADTQRPVDVITDVVNDLGVKILQQYSMHGNVAFSPTGVAFVLVALYEGSAGRGNQQIVEAMGLPSRDVTRIGFRDIHRRLRSYLNADGFLGGLTLSRDNIGLRPEYEDTLRFYGFDLSSIEQEANVTVSMGDSSITTELPTSTIGSTSPTVETTNTSIVPDTTTTVSRDIVTTLATGSTQSTTSDNNQQTVTISTSVDMQTTLVSVTSPRAIDTSSTQPSGLTTSVDGIVQQPSSSTGTESVTDTPANTPAINTDLPATVTDSDQMSTVLATNDQSLQTPSTIVNGASGTVTDAVLNANTENIGSTNAPGSNLSMTADTQVTPTSSSTTLVAPITSNGAIASSPETISDNNITSQPSTEPSISANISTEITPQVTNPNLTTVLMTTTIVSSESVTTIPPVQAVVTNTSNLAGNSSAINANSTINSSSTNNQTIANATTNGTSTSNQTVTSPIGENTISMNRKKKEIKIENVKSDSNLKNDNIHNDEFTQNRLKRKTRSSREYFSTYSDEGIWMQDLEIWKSYGEPIGDFATEISFLVNGCDVSLVSASKYIAVLPFAYFPSLHAVALEFPLDDPRYNIILLMPTDKTDTHRLARDLSGKSLRSLRKRLQPTWVRATIPSFMLHGFVTLTSFLQRLGILDVFEPRVADLSPMTSDLGVYARDVQQSIGVNIRNYMKPDRTHSRESSNVVPPRRDYYRYLPPGNGLFERAEPVPFTALHPFLYFIIDAETSVSLIAGRIDDPLNSRIL